MGILNDLRFTLAPTAVEKEAKARAMEIAEASQDGFGQAIYSQDGEKRIMSAKAGSIWTRNFMILPADIMDSGD